MERLEFLAPLWLAGVAGVTTFLAYRRADMERLSVQPSKSRSGLDIQDARSAADLSTDTAMYGGFALRKFLLDSHPALSKQALEAQKAFEWEVSAGAWAQLIEPRPGMRVASELAPAASTSSVVLVNSLRALELASSCLSTAKVVGVDLEHSPHSFHGYVCVVQVSDGRCDYVIDVLVPEVRSALRELLGPLFMNTQILKVFHAAGNDVRWLHSNFGIFVCNVLDTSVAARCLNLNAGGLDRLLAHYDVQGPEVPHSKSYYQRADWRRRPLPQDFITYAAADARVLLPLASKMLMTIDSVRRGNAAVGSSPGVSLLPRVLRDIAQRSHQQCMQRYDVASKEAFDPYGSLVSAMQRLDKLPAAVVLPEPVGLAATSQQQHAVLAPVAVAGKLLSPLQAHALDLHVSLCQWRHETALARDECVDDVAEVDGVLRVAVAAAAAAAAASGGTYSSSDVEAVGREEIPEAFVQHALAHVSTNSKVAVSAAIVASRLERILARETSQGSALQNSESPAPDGGGGSFAAAASASSSQVLTPFNSASIRDGIKQRRAARIFVPRAAPLYNNIQLLSPDGTVMARIDRSKAQWYLDKGAALVYENGEHHIDTATGQIQERTVEDGTPPLRIRLIKAPKGMGHAGDTFHLAPRRNQCVICGLGWSDAVASGRGAPAAVGEGAESAELANGGTPQSTTTDGVLPGGLIRCYVVPRAYRQHFPLAAKSYTSHDVVLTCTGCHRRADVACGALTRKLAREMGIPMSTTQYLNSMMMMEPEQMNWAQAAVGGVAALSASHRAAGDEVDAEDSADSAAGMSSGPGSVIAPSSTTFTTHDNGDDNDVDRSERTLNDCGTSTARAASNHRDAPFQLRDILHSLQVLKRSANALVRTSSLPAARIGELRQTLMQYRDVILAVRHVVAADVSLSADTGIGDATTPPAMDSPALPNGNCDAVDSDSPGHPQTSPGTRPKPKGIGRDPQQMPISARVRESFLARAWPALLASASMPRAGEGQSEAGASSPPDTATHVSDAGTNDNAVFDITAVDVLTLCAMRMTIIPTAVHAHLNGSKLTFHSVPKSGNAAAAEGHLPCDASSANSNADLPGTLGSAAVVSNSANASIFSYDPAEHIIRSVMMGDHRWKSALKHFHHDLSLAGRSAGELPSNDGSGTAAGSPGADGSAAAGSTSILPTEAEFRIITFVKRWRAHFVRSLSPAAMPEGWSIDYKVFAAGHRTWDKEEPVMVKEVAAALALRNGAEDEKK